MSETIKELKAFLASAPTPFHAVSVLSKRLDQAGFTYLPEDQSWKLQAAGCYYTTRNGSSIVAWKMPAQDTLAEQGFRMVGAHTDSPCLKVKPQPELQRKGYNQLGVEVYGGVLLNPWFDRDLSMAGRVSYVNAQGTVEHGLVDFEKPIAMIPSLAIHLDREANNSRSINAQTYLPVILSQSQTPLNFKELLAAQLSEEIGTEVDEVLDYEILLYDTQPPAVIGLNQEFLASARLDNLLSCYIGLKALLDSETSQGALLVCNDHEEVGSMSAAGAQGPLLAQVLERIVHDPEARARMYSKSMLVSADNAHGIHPNFIDRHDENHGPLLNAGPVIKINANQRYASNSETSAIFRHLARQADVPVQAFVVRSDMACGSTIGPITAAELGVRTIDVGVPQFAMHSIREVAGVEDVESLIRVLTCFYRAERL